MTAQPVENLEQKIGHNFKDKDLLHTALTHSSAASSANYERLEFLGDRVLGLVIAHLLYEKFPHEREGDLAKRLSSLVQGSMLAEIAVKINLGDFIQLSVAERNSGGGENDNILADVFEAIIGALYMDSGLDECSRLIRELWEDVLDTMKAPPQHPKTSLQEWAQGQALPLPVYEIADQQGPDHAPVFDVRLQVKGYEDVVAQGRTRQEAEKEAALIFMKEKVSSK